MVAVSVMAHTRFRVDLRGWTAYGEAFLDLAKNIPSARRGFLSIVGKNAKMVLLEVYYNVPISGRSQPTAYTGEWGASVRIFIDPRGNWVMIRAGMGLSYSDLLAGQRVPPKPLTELEKMEIREWAETKMGISSPRQSNAIIRNIERMGIQAIELERAAFDRSTPHGKRLDDMIDRDLEFWATRLIDGTFNARAMRSRR